jgi:hypothetical protein
MAVNHAIRDCRADLLNQQIFSLAKAQYVKAVTKSSLGAIKHFDNTGNIVNK